MNEVNYTHSTEFHNEKAALSVLPYVFKLAPVKSIIDIGCGTGSWLSASKKLGIKEVKGIDGIKVDESIFLLEEDEFILHNLKEPLLPGKRFDLCICLEVVEHLPGSAADNMIDIMTDHADLILFSAAIPDQTGDHHINEQWPDYWQKKFKAKGFYAYDILRPMFWDNEDVDWWYRQNLLLYATKDKARELGDPEEKVLSLVHPELLKMKEADLVRAKFLIKDHIEKPRFFSALKKVYRSFTT
ncbi:MAG: class I SAM-dependent methyltransferase [Sphingobacteriales bacterium]|nr:MAG: class I SAM-dependent methyltransferase [Sphingobacteriales bacterium]